MSTADMSLHEVLNRLQAENLLGPDDTPGNHLDVLTTQQPWYIRAMVGLGAWLASLLLIGFVASFSLVMDGGYAVVGTLLIIGAILVRRRSDNDFLVQCTLACSLAGQALCAYGVAEALGHDRHEIFLGLALAMSALLFFVYPDRIHRVIMVCLAAGSFTGLLYAWEWNALIPVLGPLFAGALILLHRRRPHLVAGPYAAISRPLMNGLMLSAFAVLLLSTVYVLPELGLETRLYPRPWISTILFGALLFYAAIPMVRSLAHPGHASAGATLYGLIALIVACSWAAPGLLLGLIVTILGATHTNRTYIGAGLVFCVIFLATYFYGIEISMLAKSLTLVSAGTVLLVSRRIILRLVQAPGAQEAHHV